MKNREEKREWKELAVIRLDEMLGPFLAAFIGLSGPLASRALLLCRGKHQEHLTYEKREREND